MTFWELFTLTAGSAPAAVLTAAFGLGLVAIGLLRGEA